MTRPVVLMIVAFLFFYALLPVNANKSHAGKMSKELQLTNREDTVPYATVYFYRAYFPKYFSNVKKAPIYINDSLVHELKANTFLAWKITKEGKLRVAVDKNQDTEIQFKLKFGNEYYFRIDVTGGIANKKTSIESVDNPTGREEIGLLPKKAFEEK